MHGELLATLVWVTAAAALAPLLAAALPGACVTVTFETASATQAEKRWIGFR